MDRVLAAAQKQTRPAFVLALSLCLGYTVNAVFAAPANEIFSSSPVKNSTHPKKVAPPPVQPSNPVAAPGAQSMMSASSPELTFFETLDTICYKGFPTEPERFVLQRQFDQEAEKVAEWIKTAKTVSRRYRNTAISLRNLQIPNDREDLQQYRDMRSQWFDAAAQVYEQMYKPKAPAQTMEELEGQLRKVDQDADSVANQKKTILAMDRKLRRLYRIHEPRETDKLQGYVMGVPKSK